MTMLKTVFIAAIFITTNPILAMDANVPTGTVISPLEAIEIFITDPRKIQPRPGHKLKLVTITRDFEEFVLFLICCNLKKSKETDIIPPYHLSLKELQTLAQNCLQPLEILVSSWEIYDKLRETLAKEADPAGRLVPLRLDISTMDFKYFTTHISNITQSKFKSESAATLQDFTRR
jgi:hypothetical protein